MSTLKAVFALLIFRAAFESSAEKECGHICPRLEHLECLKQTRPPPSSLQLRSRRSTCRKTYHSGQYLLQLRDKSAPIAVVCLHKQQLMGDTQISSVDGSENFFRNWVDYRDGFGNLSRYFWLGLENIYHTQNAASCELLVEMVGKYLNLEEICLKNNTGSIRNITIPNLEGRIINSCQHVDRQDQYLMQLTSKSIPFPVVCVKHHAMTGDGWLVIQQRVDGSEEFYRSWVDYREGFGDLNREFWLGLERIHEITNSARHELLVEMVTFEDKYYYARYSSFEIGNEQENYILKKLGSYSGTAGDSMRAHLGMRFSTYDNDNDRFQSTGCAVKYIGAWWYDECFKKGANLNGKYRENGWLGLGSPMKSLLYVRMMLRKYLNLEEICLKNNTGSVRNVTISNIQERVINSCQHVDRQDQYLMQLTSKSIPFPVVCVKHHAMTGDGWLVIQQRVDGSEEFYRSWVDYREGFGDLNRDFWLGLERIHEITNSARHELLVEMVTFDDRYYYARYSSFEIGNEQEKYILKKLGSYSGTAGDALKVHVYGAPNELLELGRVTPGTYCTRQYDECYRKKCRLQSPNYPGMYPRNVTCYWDHRRRWNVQARHGAYQARRTTQGAGQE
ncbi:hypothetical protein pipiens_007140, partial [Culex pipiens pipiens]